MPVPPTDATAAGSPARNPARVMLDSPLAAATRARVYHRRTRPRPRERGLRLFALLGTLLLHLLFLFGFVLGPAYQPTLPPASKQQYMQVRLIEPPELQPPPPVRGTPPKVRGPRHQGHAGMLAAASRQPAATAAATPQPASAMPPIVPPALPAAPVAQPLAVTTPPVSLPQPAPTPQLQPILLAGTPPQVHLPTPPLAVPVPPKFQPERVRAPQLEGNRAPPPPPSLALPELPPQAAPPIAAPSIALNLPTPRTPAPASIQPAPLVTPAAPPVPALQPIALPAQPSPTINLQAELSQPVPPVPRVRPQLQAPTITAAAVQPQALPPTPAARPQLQPSLPEVTIATRTPPASIQPVQAPASLSVPAPTAIAVPPLPASAPGAPASAPAAPATAPAPTAAAATSMASSPQPGSAATPAAASAPDISTAPDATPQGSDSAILGTPAGIPAAPASSANAGQKTAPGGKPGRGAANAAAGQIGGNQPGAPQGEKQGALGGYVELKPRGDTRIMNHGSPNIGYRPTRFDKDWTPEGESSIDTALRRAVEKTSVSHTFHLPRGVRVECSLHPLLPIALFGCRNPDPPPVPVADKVYDRLHMAPANPVAPPTPVSAASAPAPIRLDNSALCATAHVAGAPPPPGCETVTLPVQLAHPAAASSSSWVPASDQFH